MPGLVLTELCVRTLAVGDQLPAPPPPPAGGQGGDSQAKLLSLPVLP